jgi:hypothetical protein
VVSFVALGFVLCLDGLTSDTYLQPEPDLVYTSRSLSRTSAAILWQGQFLEGSISAASTPVKEGRLFFAIHRS